MTDTNAARLGPGELVYIEKVRQAMRRLASQAPEPQSIRQAVQTVRDLSTFDVEVPTASRRKEFEYVKTGIKRLSVWYMRYLAAQLNAFANSVTQMGDALATRTEKLEAASDDVLARLAAAEERLGRLEAVERPGVAAGRPGHPEGDHGPVTKTAGAQATAAGEATEAADNGSAAKPSSSGAGSRRATQPNRGASNRPRNNRRKGSGS